MSKSLLNQISSAAYKVGRTTRTARAIERSAEEGSPMPLIEHEARKAAWRENSSVTRSILKIFGL